MPSISSVLIRTAAGDVVNLGNQNAQITVPPLSEVDCVGDLNSGADLVVLPAQAGKSYVIHGYIFVASNTGATTCPGVNLMATMFKSGKTIFIDELNLTPSADNRAVSRMQGLNVLTFPGTPVYLHPHSAIAPYSKNVVIYYTVVDV